MAIKIVISQHVKFKAAGSFIDADGASQKFDFQLTAKRLGQDALDKFRADLVTEAAKSGNHHYLRGQLAWLVTAWDGVKDEHGEPVPYTSEAFDVLLQAYPGLGLLLWQTYQDEVGAKAKN